MNKFQTPESVTQLEQEAASWIGTPFWPNSAVKGEAGGVSCHNLVAEILFACGVPRFPVPTGPANWNASRQSIIEPIMDEHTEFAHLNEPGEPVPMEQLRPGDILGFRIGGCLHHLALVLPGEQFVHCLRGAGVHVSRLDDSTFLFDKAGNPRLVRAWRP